MELEGPHIKHATLNRSQALVHIINANKTYFVAPRASGKTSGGIGPRIAHLSNVMPRAQIGLISDKYDRIKKNLLPAIENYWKEHLNYVEDVDYVKFKKPPEDWIKPLFPISDFEHVISFASGTAICMLSLQVSGSGNGFNLQALIGDEAKFFDEAKLKNEVLPAVRGCRDQFGHLPEFQSTWFFTDKWGENIRWVLAQKEKMNAEAVDVVYTLQLEIIRLTQLLTDKGLSDYAQRKTLADIKSIQAVADELRKDLVYYCEALPYENIDVLGEKYYRDLQLSLKKNEYEVAILNQDPDKVESPFYPDFTEHHLYENTTDYNPNLPLIITPDYQFSIFPLCVSQFDKLPGNSFVTLNFLQSIHALAPEGMEQALDMFCDRYADHREKHAYYVYDHTAIGRRSTGKSHAESVCFYLMSKGWCITEVYTGDAPDHDIKYKQIKAHLQNRGERSICVEKNNNKYLIRSMNFAAAVTVRGKTKKDKSSEDTRKGIPQEDATHFSDCFDMTVWACLELNLIPWYYETVVDIAIGQ